MFLHLPPEPLHEHQQPCTKAGIKCKPSSSLTSHLIPPSCYTLPVPLGSWGEVGGQETSVFNGFEDSSLSLLFPGSTSIMLMLSLGLPMAPTIALS